MNWILSLNMYVCKSFVLENTRYYAKKKKKKTENTESVSETSITDSNVPKKKKNIYI